MTPTNDSENNMVDKIIRYESGEMDFAEIVEFFQGLINNGLAWSLQGHYGRTASVLIDEGHCTLPEDK